MRFFNLIETFLPILKSLGVQLLQTFLRTYTL